MSGNWEVGMTAKWINRGWNVGIGNGIDDDEAAATGNDASFPLFFLLFSAIFFAAPFSA
jgi:hypothetical protein